MSDVCKHLYVCLIECSAWCSTVASRVMLCFFSTTQTFYPNKTFLNPVTVPALHDLVRSALINLFPLCSPGPPVLKQQVSPHLVVRLGDDVRLSCPVAATPPPMLEWKKDGTQILDAWDRFSLHENMLRVSRVTADDAGVYVCIAINGFGTMRVATELFVIGEFGSC